MVGARKIERRTGAFLVAGEPMPGKVLGRAAGADDTAGFTAGDRSVPVFSRGLMSGASCPTSSSDLAHARDNAL